MTDRLPKPLRRLAAEQRPAAHIPYWNPLLQEDYCHADGEPWPCLHHRQTAPPRCKCSHSKSTHTGGAGQCWSAVCGCREYRLPDATPPPASRVPTVEDINDYLRQKGELPE